MKTSTNNVLYSLRKNMGLSQDEVAEAIGISRVAYTRYENGTRVPKSEIAAKLSNFFHVPVQQLIFGDESSDLQIEKPVISDEDIRFALSGGEEPISKAQFEEVKQFVRFIRERDKSNGNK